MLKKVISESKSLGNLKSDSGRLLYTWIIPFLDIEGRHSADPDIIKGHVFPKVKSMTVAKIRKLLPELVTEGLVILYRNDGESYLQLTKFQEHQKLDPLKEGKSKIPAPRPEDVENKATPDNSGVTPENSSLSKVKISKVQVKRDGRTQSEFDPLFDEFWGGYPKKVGKEVAREKFMILARAEKIPELIKATNGYMDYLKSQKVHKNFDQEPMNPATFLMKERWRDYAEFKYEPPM